jgi:hypothetical protein
MSLVICQYLQDVSLLGDDMFAGLRRQELSQARAVGSSNSSDNNNGKAGGYAWSAMDVCEAYAKRKNFTVKGSNGRPDTHRAAIEIIQDVLDGRVVVSFAAPPVEHDVHVTVALRQMTKHKLFALPTAADAAKLAAAAAAAEEELAAQ